MLNLFIVTKRISDRHHFCKWKFLYSILQVEVSAGTMQLTLSMAIIQVITSVTSMQVLRWYFLLLVCWWIFLLQLSRWLFCCNCAVRSFWSIYAAAANMWVTIFVLIMQKGVSVAIMHVVFSAVHYAHDCFYCNYAG